MDALIVIVVMIIANAGWSLLALYFINPYAVAFVVGMFKISTPAIDVYCTEKAAGQPTHYARVWLRGWRRKSRLRAIWPFVPMFGVYLFFVSIYYILIIVGTYLVLTGQSEEMDVEIWVMGLVNGLISLVTIYYLLKDPRRLWMLHRQYRHEAERRTVKP